MTQHIFQFPKPFTKTAGKKSIPIYFVDEKTFPTWNKKQSKATQSQIKLHGFTGSPKKICKVINDKGTIECFVAGIASPAHYLDAATLAQTIQNNFDKDFIAKHTFVIKSSHNQDDLNNICIGWGLAAYKFDAYKKQNTTHPVLLWPKKADQKYISATIQGISLIRNLINTPANDLGTDELAAAAKKVAETYKAKITLTKGAKLEKEFPMIHAVGKASPRPPQLIDIKWGNAKHPKVTLVGKGIIYDTGGLNLKPGMYMRDMKKDMGGAAHVLGVAWMIMALKLPVRLRVLIPAAENAVAGNAFRPGDVLQTRKGKTVEICDTDAEGRLVVGDALTYACEAKPDLLIDFCTLTGAARVALGYDIPAFFSNNETFIDDLRRLSIEKNDPCWPLPLWQGYAKDLSSNVADICNEGKGRGGAIEAALFLEQFIDNKTDWIHLDCFAWQQSAIPGRPQGGADTGMRAIFNFIKKRYT